MSDVFIDKYGKLIDGYIRSLVDVLTIPSEINRLIYSFYPQLDKWSKDSLEDGLEIDKDGNIVTRTRKKTWGWINAYGTQKIKPIDYITENYGDNNGNNIKYTIIKSWKLKMEHITGSTFIGIIADSRIDAFKKVNCPDYFCASGPWGYGLYSNGQIYPEQKSSGLGPNCFKDNAKIEVILLFKNNQASDQCCLAFRRNGGDIKIAIKKLDPNESYLIAVSFFEQNNRVKFID